MPTRSIDYDDFKLLFFEEIHTFLCNLNWISFFLVPKEGTLDFSSIHFQLFKGTSSECIGAHKTYSPPLPHVVVCEFSTSGSLTRTLQANKHDNIRLAFLKLVRMVL